MDFAPNFFGDSDGEPPIGNAAVADVNSLYVAVGSAPTKTITCSTDISGMTLEIVIESLASKTDLTTIANANISKSTVYASFVVPSAVTLVERTLRANVRDMSNNETVGSVLIFITYCANGD